MDSVLAGVVAADQPGRAGDEDHPPSSSAGSQGQRKADVEAVRAATAEPQQAPERHCYPGSACTSYGGTPGCQARA